MARQTKRKAKAKLTKADKDISALDSIAKKLLATIDDTYNEQRIIASKNTRMQEIIDNELQFTKGMSNGSIIDFVATVTKSGKSGMGNNPNDNVDVNELFTQDVGNLFGYFQEMYKNKYIELADLKFITKFIPAIGEAVKTTLDAIVGADDMSTTITRTINLTAGLTDEERNIVMAEIERMENDEKLLKKLKNIAYKKTLVSGNFYIYAVPYAELFEEYDRLVKTGKVNPNPLTSRSGKGQGGANKQFNINANESYIDYPDPNTVYEAIEISMDSFSSGLKSMEIFNKEELGEIEDSIKRSNLTKYNVASDTDYLVEALEGAASIQAIQQNLHQYTTRFPGSGVMPMDYNFVADGTVDINKAKAKPSKFTTVGTYIKYIDANHMIPIKVFNQIIGYYHVHDTTVSKKDTTHQSSSQTNLLSVSSNLFNSTTLTEKKREAAVRSIIDTISEGIMDKFSNKFVNKNADFKNIIADCIIANGMINNNFQIQFIPAKHIVPFVINEDENGNGESILQDALFPAKMLLSLIVSKLLTYMNKSGNKTIVYVNKGPINVNGANHVQRVLRMLQESQITFSDLLSTNLTFSKFTRDGNIQIPKAKNGDRLVEFETQEGQQVDMKPEMEEWLEKQAIMGTGVPSVIMEYTDAADYAKSIVTANIKFASRIASLQADLEEATTVLYRILIWNSNLDDSLKQKVVNNLTFCLPRPKVLSNQNIADYLQTIQGSAQTQADIMFGTNGADEDNPDAGKIKDEFIKATIVTNSPFIDWEAAEQRVKDSELAVIEKKKIKDESSDGSTNDDLGDLGGGDDEF